MNHRLAEGNRFSRSSDALQFFAGYPCCRVLLLCFVALQNGRVIMKYLLLIALFFVVLWALRKAQSSRSGVQAPPASRVPEQMVKCAHCGVNQPVSESILTQGHYYCCEDHRHVAESRDS